MSSKLGFRLAVVSMMLMAVWSVAYIVFGVYGTLMVSWLWYFLPMLPLVILWIGGMFIMLEGK